MIIFTRATVLINTVDIIFEKQKSIYSNENVGMVENLLLPVFYPRTRDFFSSHNGEICPKDVPCEVNKVVKSKSNEAVIL